MGKKKWFLIFSSLIVFLLLPLSLSAWDSRLYSLGAPTLSMTGAVPNGYNATIFPTDEYGLGLSAVPDALDVFTLPQQLANSKLFPSTSIILDSTNLINPNGGMVLGLGKQFVVGVFLFRPTLNGWVTGAPRSDFGLGGSYAADSTVAVVAPTTPANLADLIFAVRLGNLLIGGGAGVSFNQAANTSNNISGTANSTTTDLSSSYVVTGRLGASLPLGPVALDASALVMYGSESASRVSGAAALPTPNLNNSLSATDFTFSVNVRAIVPLASTLDLVALGGFALLPQNYSAGNAAGAIMNTTALIDGSQYMSFGGGAGVNWKPAEPVMINALLTVIYGDGSWVSVAGGVTPRPTNSVGWLTFRPVLDGEFKIASWATIRGGVFAFLRSVTTTINPNTGGTASTTVAVQLGIGANGGFGFQITEKTALDILVNLANFDGSGGPMQVPGLSASLKVDL